MKFVIHQLKIWFNKGIEPRILDFVPNKVNVITGDSGTGKTNILAIIDYCLLSTQNNIVEQVINENAEWYSILFSINNHKYFLGRRKEPLGQESSDVCLIDNESTVEYPIVNTTANEAKAKLNEFFEIHNIYPFNKEKGIYPFEISFRTNLLFNYLTERIITLDNIFLDFDYFEPSLLGNFKSYVIEKALGFDDSKLKQYEKTLKEIKDGQVKFNKQRDDALKSNNKLNDGIDRLIDIACTNELLDNQIHFNLDSKISALQEITQCYSRRANEDKNSDKINVLIEEERALKFELRGITRAEKEFIDYEKNLTTFKDVLYPIEVLKQQSENIVRSFETQQLINALSLSLNNIKNSNVRKVLQIVVPQTDKDRIKHRIKELRTEIDKSTASNVSIPKHSSYAFVLATEIKRDLEKLLHNKPKIEMSSDIYMPDFVEKCMYLEKKINDEKMSRPTLINSINKSIQIFYDKLNSMENYSDCEINFNMENYIIQLKQPGSGFPYRKIGSKSNDMFLHLCLFLGVHNLIQKVKDKKVLPFLFIDQPSIPYYDGSSDVNNNDRIKLLDAFKLLDNFISYMNKHNEAEFQIILIEHAPKSYWEDPKLCNFHTVEIFTKENKLIPKYITDQK